MRSPLRIQPAEVRAFLLDSASPADPAVLQAAGLAAFAYCVLPTDDLRRAVLRADYLCSLQRHLEIRRELVRLLAIWADADVEALLFKGFHLAEFLYPYPGMRFHGDIDVLVRPERVRAAVAAATATGWAETLPSSRFAHNACELLARAAKVDLHRYVLHCNTPWARVQHRITEAVWELARPMAWEGVTVRVPAAVDALLVGVVLQRLWGDGGYLKPHDATDTRLLFAEVDRDEVRARARDLRCERTLSYFLERCDPDRGRFELAPSGTDRRRLARIVLSEQGRLGRQSRTFQRLVRGPGVLADILRVLPAVAVARRRLRKTPDLAALFQSATRPLRPARSSLRHRYRTVRGIRWATRLLRLNPDGDCLLRSLAIYTELRGQGWPVTFISGVRREGAKISGHAWVEHEGCPLPELREPSAPDLFREVLRWPVESTGGSERHAPSANLCAIPATTDRAKKHRRNLRIVIDTLLNAGAGKYQALAIIAAPFVPAVVAYLFLPT